MVRKVKTEKGKKKQVKKIIIIVLITIILIALFGFCLWKFVFDKKDNKVAQPVKILDSLDEYGYDLSDKDSSYYKKEYESLKSLLKSDNVDEKEYSTLVARMFTIDLYTLSTKINKYDVGGAEFYHKNKKAMFEQKVMDTLYSTMLDNTFGDRKQELPEVKDIETVSVEETTYKIDETDVEGYLVKLNITYVKDLNYDTEASVVVCKEDGVRWSVVDFQPTLNPKYK